MGYYLADIEYTDIDELTIEADDRKSVAIIFAVLILALIAAALGIIPIEGGNDGLVFGGAILVIAGISFFSANLYYKIVINRKTGQVTVERVQLFVLRRNETSTIQHIRLQRERQKNDGIYEYSVALVLDANTFGLCTSSDETEMLTVYEKVNNFLEAGKVG